MYKLEILLIEIERDTDALETFRNSLIEKQIGRVPWLGSKGGKFAKGSASSSLSGIKTKAWQL